MVNFSIGDLIQFSYPAVHKQNTKAHDKSPKVLVLTPSHYNPKKSRFPLMYGINFNYLSNDQINLLRMVLSPSFHLSYYPKLQKKNFSMSRHFDVTMTRAANVNILSPENFYDTVLKPLIYDDRAFGETPYRLYRPDKMTGVRIVTPARVMMGDDLQPPGLPPTGITERVLAPDTPIGDGPTPGVLPKLTLFEKFRNKFQHARGPKLDTRLPVFEKFRNKFKK